MMYRVDVIGRLEIWALRPRGTLRKCPLCRKREHHIGHEVLKFYVDDVVPLGVLCVECSTKTKETLKNWRFKK